MRLLRTAVFSSFLLWSIPVFSSGRSSSGAVSDSTASSTGPTGIISVVAGTSSYGYAGNGGQATDAQLNSPESVAFGATGDLYIADTGNEVIRKVTHSTGIISTFAGRGQVSGFSGDGGKATSALLNNPTGVAIDPSGNVYVADNYNCVIRRIDIKTSIITTVAGQGSSQNPSPNCKDGGDGGPAAEAFLNLPTAIAFDSAGNLYIADTFNQSIRRVDAESKIITTVAGVCTPNYPDYCEEGADGDGGPATRARLGDPEAIAFDSDSNLYIADTYSNRIRRVDAETGIIRTVAGADCRVFASLACMWGYSPDGVQATEAAFGAISGVAIDPSGNLILSESGNALLRKVDVKTGILTTIAGQYRVNGYGFRNESPATDTPIDSTGQLSFDHLGNLYLTECGGVGEVCQITGSMEPTVAPPTFTPPADAYGTTQNVKLADLSGDSTIYYTLDGSTPSTNSTRYMEPIMVSANTNILAFATAPGLVNSPVSAGQFLIEPQAPAPAITPKSGTYTIPVSVRLTDADSGPTSYRYTTDGSNPTIWSAPYDGALQLTSNTMLKVIAIEPNHAPSPVTTAFYTINLPTLPAPTISPASGNYTGVQTITIRESNSGATVYYTMDGSIPTTKSSSYPTPFSFNISSDTKVKAVAIRNGYNNSPVASATYAITVPTPRFSLKPGTYIGTKTLYLSDAIPGALIFYTLDGSTPTAAHRTVYNSPISIAQTTTVTAKAAFSGSIASSVVFAAYTIEKAPESSTAAATGVSSGTATLNGAVNPQNAATTWWFVYGKSSTDLTLKTPERSLAAGPHFITLSAPLTGLPSKTRYYFRLESRNVVGLTSGSVLSFVTQ